MLRIAAIAAFLLLLAPGCTDLAALDSEADGPALAPSEQDAVREQGDKALADGRFKTAWNHEVAAGADRARLERIALAALEAQSGQAEDMFVALREKHGALSNGARSRVDGMVDAARQRGSWSRALELELMTADDPPTFTRAWAVYRGAPVERAPSLLETLQEAKADATATEEGD
ncbi:MAG: hypothetical protein QNJ90_04365 [Planctomycetota bacterium]|nr:hypothetical protein [Planctomycetota bacterium]